MEETFKDIEGLEWKPIFSTSALLDICRACNATIANLIAMNLNIGDLGEALWIACRWQAKERGIDRDMFFSRVTPAILPSALSAGWNALRKAFPQMGEMKIGQELLNSLPFAIGKSAT